MTRLVTIPMALVLLAPTLARAAAPAYTLAEANDWSDGDFFRVRFVVDAETTPDAAAAEAIARDLVERRVKRRVLHVADVRIYGPGANHADAPGALVLWAHGGDAGRKPSRPQGDYSGFTYSTSVGPAAAAAARRLDSGALAPAPPPVVRTSSSASAGPTPVRIDLGPGEHLGGSGVLAGSVPPIGGDPRSSAAAPAAPAVTPEAAAVTRPAPSVPATEAALRADILSLLSRWRASWEARDLVAYLGFYAPGFRSGSMDLEAWRAQKTRVFASAGNIRLDFRDIEITGEADRAIARFTQDYRSELKEDLGTKTLTLVRLGSTWKILREDWVAE